MPLLITEGFKDLLDICAGGRYDLYDLMWEPWRPPTNGSHTFEVPERMGANGQVFKELDEDRVREIAAALAATRPTAGALLFYYLRFVEPGTFSVESAIDVQLVVLLGGAAVWAGPVVGAAVFAFLPEVLDLSPVQARLANGLALIAVITWMPLGLAGMVKRAGLLRTIRASDRNRGGGADVLADAGV